MKILIKDFLKRFSFILITSITVICIFQDIFKKPFVVILLIASVFLFWLDYFLKKIFKKYVTDFFKRKEYPAPDWINKISDSFLSITLVLFTYRLGIDVDTFFKLDYHPSQKLLENMDLYYTIIALFLASSLVYFYWSIFAYLRDKFKEVYTPEFKLILRNNFMDLKKYAQIFIKSLLFRFRKKIFYKKVKITANSGS